MKYVLAVLALSSVLAQAAPLTPVASVTRDCMAKVTDATYRVAAVCWKNKNGEYRMWFPNATYISLRETGISTQYISNVDQACSQVNEYAYEELLGPNKLEEALIVTNEVEINYSHLDATACYPK